MYGGNTLAGDTTEYMTKTHEVKGYGDYPWQQDACTADHEVGEQEEGQACSADHVAHDSSLIPFLSYAHQRVPGRRLKKSRA